MTSITPFLSLAAPTTTAVFTSKAKELSISSKPVALRYCCYSTNGGRKDYFDVRRSNGVFACSTTPYVRRAGSQRLSFGNKTGAGGAAAQIAAKGDLSQVLSAMLPFVVAVTAVAALVQPSTFTW